MDIENSAYEDLKGGKTVLLTLFNPSTERAIIISSKVPNNQINGKYFLFLDNLKFVLK